MVLYIYISKLNKLSYYLVRLDGLARVELELDNLLLSEDWGI